MPMRGRKTCKWTYLRWSTWLKPVKPCWNRLPQHMVTRPSSRSVQPRRLQRSTPRPTAPSRARLCTTSRGLPSSMPAGKSALTLSPREWSILKAESGTASNKTGPISSKHPWPGTRWGAWLAHRIFANAVTFLASPSSSFTTGINMVVDGTLTDRVNF